MHNFVTLYISSSFWIIAKGYSLFKYYPETKEKILFAKVNDSKYSLFARCSLTRRLFRAEIRHLYHFKNDEWMCIGKNALYRLNKTTKVFNKCFAITRGSRPMNLCQSNNGIIYFGEYYYNPNKNKVHIFQSKDNGASWCIAYTFEEGEINHIHGIFQDPFSNKVWVATGDDDSACILGYTEDNFKTFIRFAYGSQQVRLCQPLFTRDEIIYATDSQYEQNNIISINRTTREIKYLQKIQGSGIYATQNGNLMLVSTTVEPSLINTDQHSHLWYSWNGYNWKELVSFEKDWLPKTFFQFGSILFPNHEDSLQYVIFYGRALKKIDGKSVVIPLTQLEK